MSWSGVAAWPERALPCHGDAVLPVSTTWRNCYRTYHIVDTCYYLGIFTCRRHRYVYDHFPFRLIVFCFVVWVYCHCKLLVAVGLPVLSSICQHSVSATAPLCIRVLRSTIIIIIIIIITRRHALPADGYSFAARHAVNVWVGLSSKMVRFTSNADTGGISRLSWRRSFWTHFTQSNHVLHSLLPDLNATGHYLRHLRHDRVLPPKTGSLQINNFLIRQIYKDSY